MSGQDPTLLTDGEADRVADGLGWFAPSEEPSKPELDQDALAAELDALTAPRDDPGPADVAWEQARLAQLDADAATTRAGASDGAPEGEPYIIPTRVCNRAIGRKRRLAMLHARPPPGRGTPPPRP